MQKKHKDEFIDEVQRQISHNTLKRDYLAYKIENEMYDESAQNRAKAKLELDAMDKRIEDLVKFDTWLNQK